MCIRDRFWTENLSLYKVTKTWCRRSPDVRETVSWTLLAPQQESSKPPTLKLKHLEILMSQINSGNMRYAKHSDTVLEIQLVAFGLFQIQRLPTLPRLTIQSDEFLFLDFATWRSDPFFVLRLCNMAIRSILFQCFLPVSLCSNHISHSHILLPNTNLIQTYRL